MCNTHLIEKFTNVLDSLALGEGDIRERLINVHSILINIHPNEIPAEHKEDWEWIQKEFVRLGPLSSNSGEVMIGPVENTMRGIRKSTGVKIAKRIYNLYWALSKNKKYA